MRLLKSVIACAVCAGLLLFADVASAQRVDGLFILNDLDDPNNNGAGVVVVGTTFSVGGGVSGSGTAGDLVRIDYFTGLPTSVNADDKQARVRQSRFSELDFLIDSETPARDLDLTLLPDKCSIDGKVQEAKGKGQVTVKCSGDDLFADFTADQLASLQAAFLDNKRVKINVKSDGSKGSISIKLDGTALQPPP